MSASFSMLVAAATSHSMTVLTQARTVPRSFFSRTSGSSSPAKDPIAKQDFDSSPPKEWISSSALDSSSPTT